MSLYEKENFRLVRHHFERKIRKLRTKFVEFTARNHINEEEIKNFN